MAESTIGKLSDLVHANELSISRLNKEERKILDQMNEEEEETERLLGRQLTDEEALAIEKGTPGGWDIVEKLGDMIAPAIKEIRSKKVQ